MQFWYWLIDSLLPFDWVQYDFMKNALAAVLLVSPLFGLLGTMVVSNRMAFFSDSIGHAALTGIAIGVLLGMNQPLLAMLVFSIFLALSISAVRWSTAASADTVIGVFSASAVALGVVVLSRGGGFARYSGYLVGDLLSIGPGQIALLAAITAGVLLFWILVYNPMLLSGLNSSLALSRGIKVRLIETIFALVLAVVVTVSIQWVGILIINALLVLPAAAARNLANNTRSYHRYSFLLALTAGVAGLILSYYWDTATGATIVLLLAIGYFITLLFHERVS
ncbi:MAG: metal ABC transporter permease [Methylocystaceae bacterium]